MYLWSFNMHYFLLSEVWYFELNDIEKKKTIRIKNQNEQRKWKNASKQSEFRQTLRSRELVNKLPFKRETLSTAKANTWLKEIEKKRASLDMCCAYICFIQSAWA